MRFEIGYSSTYCYAEPVWDNMNSLRIKPASGPGQAVQGFELRIEPATPVGERRDYFGTEVLEFAIAERHNEMSIEASCSAETEAVTLPEEAPWAAVASAAYRTAGGEFLLQAGSAREDTESLDALAAEVRSESPLATAVRLAELIPERFEYRQGVTFVGSTVSDLLAGGGGVCQDFAHLALALLRAHGIAARYVSGYLFAASDDGGVDSVEVETHAWVEALLPDSGGPAWIGLDPTNSTLGDESHVKIGHGRFYQDVPPIRGVFRGAAAGEGEARASMRRAASLSAGGA